MPEQFGSNREKSAERVGREADIGHTIEMIEEDIQTVAHDVEKCKSAIAQIEAEVEASHAEEEQWLSILDENDPVKNERGVHLEISGRRYRDSYEQLLQTAQAQLKALETSRENLWSVREQLIGARRQLLAAFAEIDKKR